jgi:hypothetical protein
MNYFGAAKILEALEKAEHVFGHRVVAGFGGVAAFEKYSYHFIKLY